MAEWYAHQQGRQVGPLTQAQLKQLADTGKLLPTDLVTTVGAKEWVPAQQIAGLFNQPPSVLPPLPGQFTALPSALDRVNAPAIIMIVYAPGRPGDCSPGLPQIRTCPIKASGSSSRGDARRLRAPMR
jgi:hypothetical protein